jgi:hypothetical protein
MKSANIPSRSLRSSESGLLWEEKLTNAIGSIEVEPYSTVRVRATGATTVTIDGVLAMTMTSGEIEKICVGGGDPTDNKPSITITIAGAAAFVQVARNTERKIP